MIRLWVCFVFSLRLLADGRAENVTIELPIELSGDNVSLYEMVYVSEGGYDPVQRTLVPLGLDSTGTLFRYGADFDFSAGGNFVLGNYSSNGSYSGSLSYGEVRTFQQVEIANSESGLQIAFAIPESRHAHLFALWVPETGAIYPITSGGLVGLQSGTNWTSLGFFTARCFQGFSGSDFSSLRLVDLSTQEAAPGGQTNTVQTTTWTNIAGQLPTIAVSAYISDTWTPYTLHTSSGSLQSLSPNWSFDGYYLSGQVGLGESFWFSRDVDGAISPTFFSNGDTWFDIRPYISEYTGRSLVTYSFQIGQEYAGRNLVVVHPDGYTSPVNQDTWDSWIQGWDDYGQPVYYSFRSGTAEIDINQSGWALVDSYSGENFGQTTMLGEGYYIEHWSAPNFISLSIRTSRASNALSLVQDNGEEWAVTVLSGTYGISASFMGRNYTIPFVQAVAPYLPDWGFHLRDNGIGDDSASIPSGATEADFSNWYLPATAIQLRVDESRWFNELHLVQPGFAPFEIIKGNMQGVWTGGAGATQFTSFQFYDAASQAHPDLIWLLWDATRNEYLDPDSTGTADFLLAYDGTDTDGDGLPDWWERSRQGMNPNDPSDGGQVDTDGDGVLDRYEFLSRTNPREKDNAILQLSVAGFVTP